jgi:D-alanyl-D-alanine carboxypeptidase
MPLALILATDATAQSGARPDGRGGQLGGDLGGDLRGDLAGNLRGDLRGDLGGNLRGNLQRTLDALVGEAGYPGMTLGVALPDGTTLGLAAGLADTASAEAMRPDHLMLQGSVGKTYFGAVALQLVHEGRLDLDSRLADHLGDLPWYHRVPNASDATLRQLMRHQSGIVRYEMNPRFMEDLTNDPYRSWTPEDRLAYLLDGEPPFPAGEGWDYSDTNYILLAMVVERITGTAAYDEIRRRILEPLGFERTVPSDQPDIPGLAQGYAGPGNPFGAFDATLVDGRLAFNPQFEWAGGGFASTAEDLARWVKDIHEGRAFDGSLLEQARTGVPAPLGPRGRYGLGVIMLELPAGTAWGHSGFMPGYRTESYYFPEHGFGLALQVNSSAPGALPRSPLAMLDDLAEVVKGHLPAGGASR